MLLPSPGWDAQGYRQQLLFPLSNLSQYRQGLLLVLFQGFLLESFQVFWDVRSCKLIDRLRYQTRKQNFLLCY